MIGSFKYDTASQPIAVGSGIASYAVNIPDGLVTNVAGTWISSSAYGVDLAYDNGFDRLFDRIGVQAAGSGVLNDLRVNGVNVQTGHLVVYIADVENRLFDW